MQQTKPSRTIRITVDCPQCGSKQLNHLEDQDKRKWNSVKEYYLLIGRYKCLGCGKLFSYIYGIDGKE